MGKATISVLLALALLGGVPASAQDVKKHTVNVTVKASVVSSSQGVVVVAASASGPPLGSGAAVFRNTSSGSTIKSKFTAFGKAGAVTGTSTTKATPLPQGGTTFAGSATITGGTGRFKGATGKLTVTGTMPKDSTVTTFKVTGKATY